jgi:hypothetical protein
MLNTTNRQHNVRSRRVLKTLETIVNLRTSGREQQKRSKPRNINGLQRCAATIAKNLFVFSEAVALIIISDY